MPFSSLRSRLILLVILALIPAFGLFVFSASDNRQHESIQVQRNALYSARLIAGEQQQFILGARQLLTALAHLRQVNDRDAAACNELFGELLKQYPLYSNLGATDARGDVFCSGVPFAPPVNVADRLWFQRATADRGFAVGEYQVGRITGKPSLIFADPILGSDADTIVGVVFAGIDLERLNQVSLQNRLAANTVIQVIDHNGTVLLRYPDPGGLVGKPLPEGDIVESIRARGEGTGEMRGADGVVALYAFSPVGGTDQKNPLYVTIGMPLQDAFADADWILRRNLVAMGIASVLVLAGAWALGHWFIMRRVQTLVHTAQQLQSGDLTARTGLAYGFSELSQLARAFDQMAGSLEQRESEQRRMKDALRRQALVFENATDGIIITDLERRILDWNPGAEKMFGYHKDQVIGQSADLLQRPEDRAAIGQQIANGVTREGYWSGEVAFVRRDASEGIAEVHIVPLRDQEGTIIGRVGINRDITSRKRAERAMQDKAATLQTLARVDREMLATSETAATMQLVTCRAAELLRAPKALIAIAAPDTPPLVATFGIQKIDRETAEAGRKWGPEFWRRRQTGPLKACGFVISQAEKDDGPAFLARERVDAVALAPLKAGEQWMGMLLVLDTWPRNWSEDEIQLLDLLAHQTALALDKARLFEDTQRKVVELAAVNRISSTLRAAQTIDEIVSPLLDEILAVLQVPSGCIYLYHAADDTLVPRAAREWPAMTIDKPREGITGQVFATGQPSVSHEFKSDPNVQADVHPHVEERWGGAYIPISAGQAIVGMLAVAVPPPREITPAEIHLLTTVAEIAGSAIHRAQLYTQTEQRLRRLTALREVDQAISGSFDLRIALSVLLGQTASQLAARAVSILLYDAATQTLKFGVGRGFRSPPSQRIRLTEGLAGRAFLERQTIRSGEWRVTGDEAFDSELTPAGARRLYYTAPLIAKGQVAGILEVFYQGTSEPDAEWLEFLDTLAGQAAIAVDNAQLFSTLQRTNAELALAYDTTLEGWSRALDLRDREGEGHTLRVAEMALRLAEAMGLNHSELGHLRRGALLHDIGKMGLPDVVLLKPGPLTDEEWKIMQQHPVYAYELLSPIAYLRPALEIPRYHHEKWDGTGYPRGLKGEQIPLVARIFAVVDVYDALQCDRTYRPAWSKSEAQEYIQAHVGKHFDPEIVPVFMNMLKSSAIVQ